ncbi:energy transducer TonB [Pseudoluteimonas lycopersici]|nr:energy transducer TonB [Lysobacter lycopersici]
MVLVRNAQPFASTWHVHPDFRRIAAYAGAIALNLALLMLVSLPMQGGPALVPARAPEVITQVVDLNKPKPKPEVVQVVPHVPIRPQVPIERQHPQVQAPPVDAPVLVDNGSEAYIPPDTTPIETTPVATGPITGMSLEYASAPAPNYPRDALRAGITGTVLLEVLVDVDGSPLKVAIHRSSGNRELDRAAQQQVQKHWRFRPASRNGVAVQAIGIVPIDFKLN